MWHAFVAGLSALSLASVLVAGCGSRSQVSAYESETKSDRPAAAPVEPAKGEGRLPLVLTFVDLRTGGLIDGLKGFSGEPVAWGLKVAPAGDGELSGREVLLAVTGAPAQLEVARKANTVVVMGSMLLPTTGTFVARWRDVDACRAKTEKRDACADVASSLPGDESQEVTFTIQESTRDQAIKQAQSEQLARQSQAEKSQCLAGMFSVLGGNIGGLGGCAGMMVGGMNLDD